MSSLLVSLKRSMLLFGATLLLSQHVHFQSVFGIKPADIANMTYDFVVIGPGPGGGPLAANLAIAGHSVLLLEADEGHGDTLVEQVPELYPQAIHVADQCWDFFVRYHANDDLHNNYDHITWRTTNGSYYVGQSPPPGSERLGAYYPLGGTLGGSATRNAMISMLPPPSDWGYIANITGDESWGSSNMHRLFQRLEHNHYLPNGTQGHGFGGYLGQSQPDPAVLEQQPQFAEVLESLAAELGHSESVEEQLREDVNSANPLRNTTQALYGVTQQIDAHGRRSDARTRVHEVFSAINPDGSKKYPLDIMFNTLATRGGAMYSVDPRYSADSTGESGIVKIKKEVIVSGGAFNSPQVLKLSGIGPADELSCFDIPVIVDLPGVGNNLQDNYETSIIAHASTNFENNGPACTMGATEDDPCLELWRRGEGPYTQSRIGLTQYRTNASASGENDLIIWQFPGAFRGFYPRAPGIPGPELPNALCFLMAKMHPRGSNGSVSLRSANPRDAPKIFFNFYSQAGRDTLDLQALLERTKFGQRVLDSVESPIGPFTQEFPCDGGCESDAEAIDRIMGHGFAHHATSSCRIGADDDHMAVLDSQLRVRGVQGLRVVDGSSFPRVPGAFPVLPIFMLSEKATDDILREHGGTL